MASALATPVAINRVIRIEAQRARAGGQTQHGRRVGARDFGHDIGRCGGDGDGVRSDDDFHVNPHSLYNNVGKFE